MLKVMLHEENAFDRLEDEQAYRPTAGRQGMSCPDDMIVVE